VRLIKYVCPCMYVQALAVFVQCDSRLNQKDLLGMEGLGSKSTGYVGRCA